MLFDCQLRDVSLRTYETLMKILMKILPAAVDMVNLPLFTGFHTCQVVQDFFHQQYDAHMMTFIQLVLTNFLSLSSNLVRLLCVLPQPVLR